MLTHAEIFLADRGKNGQYHIVDTDYQAFDQLRKFRGKIKDVAKREVFENLCYDVIEQPMAERVYQTIADVQKYFEKIIDRIENELVPEKTTLKKAEPKSMKKSASALLGGAKSLTPDVLDIVADKKNRQNIRVILRDVISSEKASAKEKKDSSYVSSQIRYVSQALKRAVDDVSKKSSKSSKSGVGDQLDEVDKLIMKLRAWINAKS